MSRYGAHVEGGATRFRVRSPDADVVWVCLFDGGNEARHAMQRDGDAWTVTLEGDLSGTKYGLRAAGPWSPADGRHFDPSKLLVDPYAVILDRRFVQSPRLAQFGEDTSDIVPRALIPGVMEIVPRTAPVFRRAGLVYEVNVRAFTMLHPEVPANLRGTVAALAHPAIVAHLQAMQVSAVELMPIVAWIDERHLPPLGLVNGWGYNPVTPMALDPGLCPGGIAELRDTVAALHTAGIGVILDLVFNHTGESDLEGGTLSLRGLDNAMYARSPGGDLINDTGCGNTLNFANPAMRALAIDTLRHFVLHAGVDGFRFDLATIMARGPGFDPAAPIFAQIAADPILQDRVMIAEPWDVGPGGYQLGRFPSRWLEWNDRFRDDVRHFWKGDDSIGNLATRLAGSSDIFGSPAGPCGSRTVNFLAAHDGFTLADTVAYQDRHNWENGESNRDGHGDNHSWNHGVEGATGDPAIIAARRADIRAMLATLFASTGTIMLTAGDEFGRTQRGNNNAYCQDNEITWLDWHARDRELQDYVARLSRTRMANLDAYVRFPGDAQWFDLGGSPLSAEKWEKPGAPGFQCISDENRLITKVDRASRAVEVTGQVHPDEA